MGDNIINNRLSPLPLEFFTKEKTSRMYDGNTKYLTRELRSIISLKFPLASIDREKVRIKPALPEINSSSFNLLRKLQPSIFKGDNPRNPRSNQPHPGQKFMILRCLLHFY